MHREMVGSNPPLSVLSVGVIKVNHSRGNEKKRSDLIVSRYWDSSLVDRTPGLGPGNAGSNPVY